MLPGDQTKHHPFHQQHRNPSVQTDQESLSRWPDPNPAKASVSTPPHLRLEGFQRWLTRESATHRAALQTPWPKYLGNVGGDIQVTKLLLASSITALKRLLTALSSRG